MTQLGWDACCISVPIGTHGPSNPVVVFVVGGNHDLSERINADCPDCTMETMTPERWDKMNAVKRKEPTNR